MGLYIGKSRNVKAVNSVHVSGGYSQRRGERADRENCWSKSDKQQAAGLAVDRCGTAASIHGRVY